MRKNIESLRVLAYHAVFDSLNFEKQLVYLKKNYSIISIEQLSLFLSEKTDLPKNPLLITFDDGDKSVYEIGLPLLNKYDLPASLFLITDLINTNKPFWWDEIEYYLGRISGNEKVWEVKKWQNKEREKFLFDLRQNSKMPLLEHQQLNNSQLKEMQDSGVTIANHSHTHPMLNNCTPEELEEELTKSNKKLQDLNFTADVFAYPNGNYSELSEMVLKKHNIKLAFLFDHKINNGKVNPLRISRLAVNDDTPLWKLKFILSGWHTRLLPFIKSLGKLKQKLR